MISPTGIEPMTFQVPVGRSNHWAVEADGEQGHTTRKKESLGQTQIGLDSVRWREAALWLVICFFSRCKK